MNSRRGLRSATTSTIICRIHPARSKGAFVNELTHKLQFWTLRIDGQRHKEIAELAKKFGMGEIPGRSADDDADTDEAEPPLVAVVRGVSFR